MKWVHLSDIHFNNEVTGTDTLLMRDMLKNYLKKQIGDVDKLFITGDYRYKGHPGTAEDVAEYIFQLAKSLGIHDAKEIHIVPGNHDLNRSKERGRVIHSLVQTYNTSYGKFDQSELNLLQNDFAFYNNLYRKIYGCDYVNLNNTNPHTIIDGGMYQLLLMNTNIISNDDKDRGNLLVGTKYILDLLRNNVKPVIVLAHHGIEVLNTEEQNKLKELFKLYNIKLILCGDAHKLLEERINDFYQITAGCMIKNDNSVDAAFTAGEITESNIKITANNWAQNLHFGENGTLMIPLKEQAHPPVDINMEPGIKKHLLHGMNQYKEQDIAIHTPQVMLLLLTYKGSSLLRALNLYTVTTAEGSRKFGDYLCEVFRNETLAYRKKNLRFDQNFNFYKLSYIQEADRLCREAHNTTITENYISYALLNDTKSNTIALLYNRLGYEALERIKSEIKENPTPGLEI